MVLAYCHCYEELFYFETKWKNPQTAAWLIRLLDEVGLPPGVVQLIHGGKDAVGALIEHPGTDAISFVGSTAPSRYIYAKAGEHGKRVQCQGGANNIAVMMRMLK